MEAVAGVAAPLAAHPVSLPLPDGSASKWVSTEFFEWFGELAIFSWRVVRAAVTPPFEFRELFRQLDEIGSKSLPLVALAGAAIGVVLALESIQSMTRFGANRCFLRRWCTPLSMRSVRSLRPWL